MDKAKDAAKEIVAELVERRWENNRDFELALQRCIAVRLDKALAERTEQCAKICNEYTRLGVLRSLDATIKSATAKEIQAKIRALNTETKS